MRSAFVFSLGLSVLGVVMLLGMGAPRVVAYEQYGQGCHNCHGDFRDNNYVSMADGQAWGKSLMSGHNSFLSNDCDACHQGGDFKPVYLASSNGGTGLASFGCLGCHGRDEGSGVRGSGLRQHHWNNGVTVCGGCHPSDSDPSVFTPVAEFTQPPYYLNPGSGHPNIPTHPCNLPSLGYSEDVLGTAGTGGLDNDGDGLYDTDDQDCAPLLPVEPSNWGRIKALYE